MRKACLLVLACAVAAGCEDKAKQPPAAPPPSKAPVPSQPPKSETPPAKSEAVKPAADVAVGDSVDAVFAKWGKPEVFKLNLEGDSMMYEFASMPPGINPEAILTFYFVPKGKAVLFKFNGTTEVVESVTDISATERDMVEVTAKRNNAPPAPPPPKPAGGS